MANVLYSQLQCQAMQFAVHWAWLPVANAKAVYSVNVNVLRNGCCILPICLLCRFLLCNWCMHAARLLCMACQLPHRHRGVQPIIELAQRVCLRRQARQQPRARQLRAAAAAAADLVASVL